MNQKFLKVVLLSGIALGLSSCDEGKYNDLKCDADYKVQCLSETVYMSCDGGVLETHECGANEYCKTTEDADGDLVGACANYDENLVEDPTVSMSVGSASVTLPNKDAAAVDVEISYASSDTSADLSGKTIKVKSSDENCAKADNAEVTTDADGKAKISISGISETACEAEITLSSEGADDVKVKVSVGAYTPVEPVIAFTADITKLELENPAEDSDITDQCKEGDENCDPNDTNPEDDPNPEDEPDTECEDGDTECEPAGDGDEDPDDTTGPKRSGEVVLTYTEDAAGKADQEITFASDDEDCAYVALAKDQTKLTTGEDGKVTATIAAADDAKNCKAVVTFTAGDKSVDVEVVVGTPADPSDTTVITLAAEPTSVALDNPSSDSEETPVRDQEVVLTYSSSDEDMDLVDHIITYESSDDACVDVIIDGEEGDDLLTDEDGKASVFISAVGEAADCKAVITFRTENAEDLKLNVTVGTPRDDEEECTDGTCTPEG